MAEIKSNQEFNFNQQEYDKRLLPPGELENREKYLQEKLGFDQEKIRKLKEDRPSLYSIETMDHHLSGLQDRGFTNPHKMIESLPTILGLGFDNIDQKISGLKDRGFTNPHKMIESLPTILGYGFDNIDQKISGLKDRGFANPHKMIESLPTILGLGFDNIDQKISGLQDRGFANPHKMIESLPTILSYGFDNIDTKLKLLSQLNNTYKLNLDPIQTIESNLPILGTKFKKLIVIARLVKEYQPSPEDIQRKINQLYMTNLESLLTSYSQKQPGDNLDDLTKKARSIQKEKLSKDYKRQLIKDYFANHPDDYKIYRDYLKGYPEKTQNG